MTCIKKWVKVSVDFLEKFVLLKMKHFGLLVGQWDKGGFWAVNAMVQKKNSKFFHSIFSKFYVMAHIQEEVKVIFFYFSV